jgi:hypothetical protein
VVVPFIFSRVGEGEMLASVMLTIFYIPVGGLLMVIGTILGFAKFVSDNWKDEKDS